MTAVTSQGAVHPAARSDAAHVGMPGRFVDTFPRVERGNVSGVVNRFLTWVRRPGYGLRGKRSKALLR